MSGVIKNGDSWAQCEQKANTRLKKLVNFLSFVDDRVNTLPVLFGVPLPTQADWRL